MLSSIICAIIFAAAVKKGNSKTNLYLRRTLSETSTQGKTQRSIIQQLAIQNNENIFHKRNTLTTAKETTSERDDVKYKEMQALQKTIRKLNLNQFHHHDLHLHLESTAYCHETTPFFIRKIKEPWRMPLQTTKV